MNSLSLGFLYLIGLAWLLCEVSMSAAGGYWTPLWLYLAGFAVMFAILGCLPLSDKAINTAGPVFSVLIGLGIVLYGFGSFDENILGGLLRCIGGVAVAALGALGYLAEKKEAH
ncbi:MAG: hypothetical protein WD342_15305 [Verrucomicrobiales bacterium]